MNIHTHTIRLIIFFFSFRGAGEASNQAQQFIEKIQQLLIQQRANLIVCFISPCIEFITRNITQKRMEMLPA